jgi:hypothetical protein
LQAGDRHRAGYRHRHPYGNYSCGQHCYQHLSGWLDQYASRLYRHQYRSGWRYRDADRLCHRHSRCQCQFDAWFGKPIEHA